jgi:hypothetical protein
MNETLSKIIQKAHAVCLEHGYSFIGIYMTISEMDVADGWDRFIYSHVHVPTERYEYIGFVRKSGEFVERNSRLTKLALDRGNSIPGK